MNVSDWCTVGTRVRWQSQAGGYAREKSGEVIAVVPPQRDPNAVLEEVGRSERVSGPGLPRRHTSYVVFVRGRGIYWPRVSALQHEVL